MIARPNIVKVGWLGLWFLVSVTSFSGEREVIKGGIAFLEREVARWKPENGCFSCHNNGDGARALYLAARAGERVDVKGLETTTKWLNEPGKWHENKGDPGFSDKRLPLIQFGAALAANKQTSKEALDKAIEMLAKEQAPDGSWKIEGEQVTGSPAAYGNDLATAMALRVIEKVAGESPTVRKARAWLLQREVGNVVAAASVLIGLRNDKSLEAEEKKLKLREFLWQAQGSTGGWGPYPQSPPESFDTALALLALGEPGRPDGRSVLERGRQFLEQERESDGGWPATTRPSGGESYAQRISTSAWVLTALLGVDPI